MFIILAVIVLILFLEVGATVQYADGEITLWVNIGFLSLKLLPKKEKKAKEPKRPKAEKPKKEKPEKPKKDLGETLRLVKAMLPAMLNALRRFRRSLSVNELTLHYTAASEDPYSAVMQYGYVSAGVNGGLSLLSPYLKLRDVDLDINVDMELSKPVVFARAAVTIAIWEILYIVIALGIEFLKVKNNLNAERIIEDGQH